jgi:hypothetical protein
MGVYDIIRRACINALDGHPAEDVRSLCIRANVMADLAMRGKYRDAKTACMVVGNVQILSRLTNLLGYPRRKCSIPRVEVVQWGDARTIPIAPSEVVDEARSECLLAKITGPSLGAQLDIKRECLPRNSAIEELQGEKQVQHLVPPDSVERMQPSPSVQTS